MRQFQIQGSDVDVITSRHNIKATQESIKALLANGTPNWVKWPEDYKNFVRESFQEDKEQSDAMVSSYKMEDQHILTNAVARKVNPMGTRDFILKLRKNGVRCFTVDNGMPQTVGLWAMRPDRPNPLYVCYLQIPAMYEWSLLRLDHHDLPAGERFRGWRTVLSQIIAKKILTEKKCHQIFGKPTESINGRRYRETLYNYRNGLGWNGSEYGDN
jgi:hypothetical protein